MPTDAIPNTWSTSEVPRHSQIYTSRKGTIMTSLSHSLQTYETTGIPPLYLYQRHPTHIIRDLTDPAITLLSATQIVSSQKHKCTKCTIAECLQCDTSHRQNPKLDVSKYLLLSRPSSLTLLAVTNSAQQHQTQILDISAENTIEH